MKFAFIASLTIEHSVVTNTYQMGLDPKMMIKTSTEWKAFTTGLEPLCRKKQTIQQSKWPALYGARTEIWYRQRHLVTSPTGFGRVKVVSTLGTGRPKRHFLTTQGPESRSTQETRVGKCVEGRL